MHGTFPGYEQRRAYAQAQQGMAGVGSQAPPAAMSHPFHHQGEPDALNPHFRQGAFHVLFTGRMRSLLP